MSLSEADRFTKDQDVDLTVLDETLERLAKTYPQKAKIVELKFFGGLTIEETAKVLELSDTTLVHCHFVIPRFLHRNPIHAIHANLSHGATLS